MAVRKPWNRYPVDIRSGVIAARLVSRIVPYSIEYVARCCLLPMDAVHGAIERGANRRNAVAKLWAMLSVES